MAGAFVAAIVVFVWAVADSPPGPEGLMGLEYFASEFLPALPRAIALGVAVVWVANKLVSLGPNYWHVQAAYGGEASVITAAAASLLLVPRLGRAVMREVDSRVHARHM